jgi:hypothetical protein
MTAPGPPRRRRPPTERGGYVPRVSRDALAPPEQVPSGRLEPRPKGVEQPEEADDQPAGQ